MVAIQTKAADILTGDAQTQNVPFTAKKLIGFLNDSKPTSAAYVFMAQFRQISAQPGWDQSTATYDPEASEPFKATYKNGKSGLTVKKSALDDAVRDKHKYNYEMKLSGNPSALAMQYSLDKIGSDNNYVEARRLVFNGKGNNLKASIQEISKRTVTDQGYVGSGAIQTAYTFKQDTLSVSQSLKGSYTDKLERIGNLTVSSISQYMLNNFTASRDIININNDRNSLRENVKLNISLTRDSKNFTDFVVMKNVTYNDMVNKLKITTKEYSGNAIYLQINLGISNSVNPGGDVNLAVVDTDSSIQAIRDLSVLGNNIISTTSSLGVFMEGHAGDDKIKGGAGADIIWGGAGTDVMTGGAGTDTFLFDQNDFASDGSLINKDLWDIITDFKSGTDKIQLNFDANTQQNGYQHFVFSNQHGLIGQEAIGKVWFDNGTLFGNVDGGNVADFAIILQGAKIISANDLLAAPS